MWRGKRYWLIGASEGLGRALARELDGAGADLVLSARSRDRLDDLAAKLSRTPQVVPCDVTDAASVARAWEEVGEIDGAIYLAALYEPMAAADWNRASVEAMCDVNFMGALRVLGHVAPAFAARDHGHIVLVGSLAGYRGLPGAVGYGAGKAGLMHLAECLRADFWRTGVKVQLFNPGYIRTRLTEKNDFRMPFLMTPEAAATTLRKGMEARAFKKDFPLAFSLIFRLGRFLPATIYYRLFA